MSIYDLCCSALKQVTSGSECQIALINRDEVLFARIQNVVFQVLPQDSFCPIDVVIIANAVADFFCQTNQLPKTKQDIYGSFNKIYRSKCDEAKQRQLKLQQLVEHVKYFNQEEQPSGDTQSVYTYVPQPCDNQEELLSVELLRTQLIYKLETEQEDFAQYDDFEIELQKARAAIPKVNHYFTLRDEKFEKPTPPFKELTSRQPGTAAGFQAIDSNQAQQQLEQNIKEINKYYSFLGKSLKVPRHEGVSLEQFMKDQQRYNQPKLNISSYLEAFRPNREPLVKQEKLKVGVLLLANDYMVKKQILLQSFFGCYDSFQNSVNTSDHIRTFRKYVEEDAEAPQYLRRLRKALKIKSVESGDGRIKAILNNCSVNIFVDVAVYCERKQKTLMQLFDEGEIDVVLCKGQESELKKLSVDEEQYRRLVREHRFYSFTKSQVFGLKHLKYGQADFGKEALQEFWKSVLLQ